MTPCQKDHKHHYVSCQFYLGPHSNLRHKIFPWLISYKKTLAHIYKKPNPSKMMYISLEFKVQRLLKLKCSYLRCHSQTLLPIT